MLDFPDLQSPPKKIYKVVFHNCCVKAGDTVQLDTVVGRNFNTGDTVIAGCHGQVEGCFISRPEYALIVIIKPHHS
ncbi:MAG: hypothetical protein JXA13_07600 [Anaerolineales bacterium]|nr:hypothetical protein [Anaerolineales bacterium]